MQSSPGLTTSLRDRVLTRLGFDTAPAPDLAGLGALYAAWCARVPFDNVRKMIALRTPGAALPGITAEDFFEEWMRHGAGGTCWPSSHALCGLLASCGFDARRVVASMRDTGTGSHGTVKVRVEGRDYLVDSSILTNAPAPCDDAVHIDADRVWPVEIEPVGGTHLIWFDGLPSADPLICRVLQDPAEPGWYLTAYEASREHSPFNQRVYARKNFDSEVRLLVGTTRFSKTAAGVDARTLSGDELCGALHTDFGISERLIAQWIDCGALRDSLEAPAGPKPPPPPTVRPSQRAGMSTA